MVSMKEKEVRLEEFKKLTSAIDSLQVEGVEQVKLKLRLQEVKEKYKIAYENFIDLFDEAWNEVLSRLREKVEEDLDNDNIFFSSLKSNLVERGFKMLITTDPNHFKNKFLYKGFWKMFIDHELKKKCLEISIADVDRVL